MVTPLTTSKLIAVCVLALIFTGCATNHCKQSTYAYFKPDNISNFTDYILVHPNDAEAYRKRGMAYEGKGQFDLALKDYNKAQMLKPHLALVYWNRGLLYYKINENDKALTELSRYQSFSPRSTTTKLLRSVIYYKQGKYGKAINGFKKVAKLDRRYTGIAYVNLATIYMEKKKYYQAWIYANKSEAVAVSRDPKNCFKVGKDAQIEQFMVLNTHNELVKKLRKG